MGRAISDNFEVARRTYEEADEALRMSLSRLIFEGSESDLKRTEVTQPAILTCSVASFRVLASEVGLSPRFAAGHSLGEWSALVAVGVLSFWDAVQMVRLRGQLMQEAVPEGQGAMAAVLGLEADTVQALCQQVAQSSGQVVSPANLNAPEQTVVSGANPAVEAVGERAKEAGAKKVVPLPVSAPFHCALMQPAAERLDQAMAELTFSAFQCPVVSNVEAQPYDDPTRTRALLKEQVTAPVRWTECVQSLRTHDEEHAIEVGPGKVLAGLCRRIDRKLSVATTDGLDDLKKVLAHHG